MYGRRYRKYFKNDNFLQQTVTKNVGGYERVIPTNIAERFLEHAVSHELCVMTLIVMVAFCNFVP